MNDDLINEFDNLGDEIQHLISTAPGSEFGEIAGNALGTLQKINIILNSTGRYEHGLQRIPDVQANLESARDDFALNTDHIQTLSENYRKLRINSGAGKHSYFG